MFCFSEASTTRNDGGFLEIQKGETPPEPLASRSTAVGDTLAKAGKLVLP